MVYASEQGEIQKVAAQSESHRLGAKKAKRRRRNTSESSGEYQDESTKRHKYDKADLEGVTVHPGSDKENRSRSSSSVSDVETLDSHADNVTDMHADRKRKIEQIKTEETGMTDIDSAKRIKVEVSEETEAASEGNLKRKRKSEGEIVVAKKVRINETIKVEEVTTSGKRNRRKKNKVKTGTKDQPQLRVISK